MKKKLTISILAAASLLLVIGCYPDEELNVPPKTYPISEDELDQFIDEQYRVPFGIAVRYKYVDRYVDQSKRVTPPKYEIVKPMLDFLNEHWIQPFLKVPNGDAFFRSYVPAEIVLVGSTMYNSDGTVTLGTADAGARITLTEVNFLDTTNQAWVFRQLGTIYHEFAHIMHQRNNLPPNWQQISPGGYSSSGSWYNLTDEQALQRGFVSPYGTSSFNEDFAELVAFLLYDPNFNEKYLVDELCSDQACSDRNEGRALLRQKYSAVLAHYKQYVGVDLLQVRALIQQELND